MLLLSHIGSGDGTPYPYIEQLKQLESCASEVVPMENENWPELNRITTSLVYHEWTSLLSSHPDAEFSHYVLTGLA